MLETKSQETPASWEGREILRWDESGLRREMDELAEEEPLEIRVRGRAISVTMRTLGHDAELAAGFLLSEGIVQSREDIRDIVPCDRNEFGNVIDVLLAAEVRVDFERLTRHVFASSSCGLCGKATIESIQNRCPPIRDESDFKIPAQTLAKMPDEMREMQSVFDRTGGLHAAAIFTQDGKLLCVREDVGRHNAVDKVLGYALLHGLAPLNQHVLVVSGRSSFEIVQKALAARVPIIAAVSAPSSLAVRFAGENRQTLIGFLRAGRMNIYCGHERVEFL